MKCRVCGYELAEGRTYCPMCGTKVYAEAKRESAAADMAWNTKDFPKPKKMEDIEMNWGNMDSFMKRDASEGYVNVEKEPPKKSEFNWNSRPRKAGDFEIPSFMQPGYTPQPAPQPQYTPQPALKPQPQPAPQSQPGYWYEQNFTASGIMKTGPAVPLAKESSQQPVPPAPPVMPWDAKDILQSAMPDATINYVRVEQPRRIADYEKAYPDYASVPSQEQKRPEEFYTFRAKNEEFQKLLDRELQKMKAMREDDQDYIPSERMTDTFVPESSVQAQDISAFEKSLFGEPQPAYPQAQKAVRPEPKPKAAFVAADETPLPEEEPVKDEGTSSPDLDELIADPLDPRFDIDTIEMTIKELKQIDEREEEERSERKQKLARMEAARDAYFAFLDANDDEDKKAKGIFAKKKEKLQESEDVSDATKIDLDDTVNSETNPALAGLYDYEDAEEETESGHGFLKFLGILVIIIALLELGIMALKHFMPDAAISQTAAQVESAVINGIARYAAMVWEWIQSLAAKIKG